LPSENVFRTRKLFASPQDFAARTEQTYSASFKCSYLMISYAGLRDDPTKGCDDNPVAYVTYWFQLYRDSKEEKNSDNGANSHDSLVTDAINLRRDFLNNRTIEMNRMEHQALVQVGDMVKVQPCEHIVNALGDWINFRLTVEVNS
jgi:hypothetical protein